MEVASTISLVVFGMYPFVLLFSTDCTIGMVGGLLQIALLGCLEA